MFHMGSRLSPIGLLSGCVVRCDFLLTPRLTLTLLRIGWKSLSSHFHPSPTTAPRP